MPQLFCQHVIVTAPPLTIRQLTRLPSQNIASVRRVSPFRLCKKIGGVTDVFDVHSSVSTSSNTDSFSSMAPASVQP